MLRTHPVTAMLLVLGIVGSLVFGSAAAANAAIWPKGFNPKQYMLNVMSSMLAGAQPDSKLGAVKRSVIQEDQKFDHSWEGLNEAWKKDSPKNIPTSYEDYVLQRQEYFNEKGIKGIQGQKATETNTGKGTKYVKPMKAPATKTTALIKKGIGVGVGVGSGTGWVYRSEIGNAVGGLFGIDTEGAYCGDRDNLGNLVAATDFITGINCDAYDVSDSYTPNDDAHGGFTMAPLCDDNGACIKELTGHTTDGFYSIYACFTGNGTPNLNYIADWHRSNGSVLPRSAFIAKATSKAAGSTDVACGSGYEAQIIYASGTSSDRITAADAALYISQLTPKCLTLGYYNDCNGPADKKSELKPTSTNPDRTFICTYTMADGSTVEKETDTFKETDDDVPSPVCPAVDPKKSDAVKSVKVDEVNKADGTKQTVYEQDTTDQYQDWWGKYPECREGACALDLVQKSTQKSCFYDNRAAEACQDWMRDPDKTEHYQCYYGGHKVDLTECYAYGDTFNPEKVLAGQGYSDPKTGETVDGQSSPNAAQKTLGRSWTDPQDFRGCLDTGWGVANPVEWVMVPVTCSLQWAFAPSTQVVTTTTNKVQNQWASKAPGKIANAVSSWSITAPGGCDIPVDVMGTHINLSPACPGQPLAGLATLSKIATTAVVAVIVFFASRRVVRSWIGDSDSSDGGSER